MPMMKSFAVFVKRPPKNGETTRYFVMEVAHTESGRDIERRIAEVVSEGRLNPIPAGGTHYKIFTTDSAQSAANQAKQSGLQYMSLEEVMRMKADQRNAQERPNAFEKDNPFADIFGDFWNPKP